MENGARLDEYDRIEMEDIMRRAVASLGGTFDQDKFDQYWCEAMARKRQRSAS